MNTSHIMVRTLIATAVAAALLVGCASTPKQPAGSAEVRAKLTALQNDATLAAKAPVATKDAEVAVAAAEISQPDFALATHRVYIADRKVDAARAQAETKAAEEQRIALTEQAEPTDRGMVLTLGDTLFATGKSELKSGAAVNLDRLSDFLTAYPDRSASIEGFTDSMGSEESNQMLSERRADSVKRYLIGRGVKSDRLSSSGRGENAPVADNETMDGRQQNRRVEVVINQDEASPGTGN